MWAWITLDRFIIEASRTAGLLVLTFRPHYPSKSRSSTLSATSIESGLSWKDAKLYSLTIRGGDTPLRNDSSDGTCRRGSWPADSNQDELNQACVLVYQRNAELVSPSILYDQLSKNQPSWTYGHYFASFPNNRIKNSTWMRGGNHHVHSQTLHSFEFGRAITQLPYLTSLAISMAI